MCPYTWLNSHISSMPKTMNANAQTLKGQWRKKANNGWLVKKKNIIY